MNKEKGFQMKTWLLIFVISATIALITLIIPVGGLNGLATLLMNGSLGALIIQSLGAKK